MCNMNKKKLQTLFIQGAVLTGVLCGTMMYLALYRANVGASGFQTSESKSAVFPVDGRVLKSLHVDRQDGDKQPPVVVHQQHQQRFESKEQLPVQKQQRQQHPEEMLQPELKPDHLEPSDADDGRAEAKVSDDQRESSSSSSDHSLSPSDVEQLELLSFHEQDFDSSSKSKQFGNFTCQEMRERYKDEAPQKVRFPDPENCTRWYEFVDAVYQCTEQYLRINARQSLWTEQLHWAIDCCALGLYSLLSITPLTNGIDTKLLILPSFTNHPCRAVFVGLENSRFIPDKLKTFMPQCEQFGTDPKQELHAKFPSMNEIHQVVIGGNTNKSVTFDEFLTSYSKVSEVDYLFVNSNDGSEYYLLKWLTERKKSKQSIDHIPICIFNAELHTPLGDHGLTEASYNQLITDFIKKSGFTILYYAAVESEEADQRLLAINAHEPFCVQKYFGHWCHESRSLTK